jgi:TetR/AcrR family tetracycline transcriptional repressor
MDGMDAQIITNAALDVLDEVGLDKLSMRLVAARLGVQVGGLYYYVADKAALLRAMADELCQQVLSQAGSGRSAPGPGRPGAAEQPPWAAEAAELCRVLRSVLSQHRDSARVLAASPLQGSLNAIPPAGAGRGTAAVPAHGAGTGRALPARAARGGRR